MSTIGLPRALYFYAYSRIWQSFFEGLGMGVMLSKPTDDAILADGIKCASSDLCLPIKAAFGHVKCLLESNEKPDFIFLPEIRKTGKGCFTCPKAIGLTPMMKHTFEGALPKIISPRLNGDTKKMLTDAAKEMGFSGGSIKNALKKAEKKEEKTKRETNKEEFKVALIGHSYMLNDNKLNMDIEKRLNKMEVSCITRDEVPKKRIAELSKNIGSKRPFWHSAQDSFGFTKYIADEKEADGVIFINSFGCGTDALSTDFCKEYLKEHGNIPAMTISLDEHTAEAGLNTRLEAFRDCMEFRKQKKDVIS